jgi:hypothetical protein
MPAPKPLKYRAPYLDGETAEWVSKIGNRSGVYIIRDKRSKKVLYVGESHTGRLRKTMLRHFQFWSGFTSGKTYSKESVEVAIRYTPPPSAVSCQDNFICKLNARDNEIRTACPSNDDPF